MNKLKNQKPRSPRSPRSPKAPKAPRSQNRKVSLKFMDCQVSLEGGDGIESVALGLLGTLVNDRLRVHQLMELEHEDDEAELTPQNKKLKPDIDFMRSYQ